PFSVPISLHATATPEIYTLSLHDALPISTGALDSNTSNEILELFDEVNANGQTIIMVTHSAAAASHAKRTLFIKDGRIYHELYRGDLSLKDYQQQISQTMMTLTNGGE